MDKVIKLRISFDSVAHLYDKTRALPEHVMKRLIQTIARELKSYTTILDAGVGTGRFAKPLQDSGFEVYGVDIAEKMISRAKERDVNHLLLGDVCFLPFKDNSFDATICIHVLHLIKEWRIALREICRVTRQVMVSINYVRENPLWKTYNKLLKKYGYERRRPGKGEWELKKLVRPSRSVFVASFETKADERLAHLAQRAYSHQWEIPEDVNEKILDELKSQFAGKVFPQELRLLVWNINSLEDFVSKYG
jgi:ubiquinone/menaquinone biosynthesis C-methylase UbiE